MTHRLFGVRHHGPGTARSLLAALEHYAPDILLLEGPPEGTPLIERIGTEGLVPPVALVVWPSADPGDALFHPFDICSPEWNALLVARRSGIPARFIDLTLAERRELADEMAPLQEAADRPAPIDPLAAIARLAGAEDPERWWERTVEEHQGDAGIFDLLLDLVADLRGEIDAARAPAERTLDERREEAMRRQIAEARSEGYERIAVVCGAWHAPALRSLPEPPPTKRGRRKRSSVEATWIPWSSHRMARVSGYGAGIAAPEWNRLLFSSGPEKIAGEWLARTARLLRRQLNDVGTAQVIDALHLARGLGLLRGSGRPGRETLNEAAVATLCEGDEQAFERIREELEVGGRVGSVPDDLPSPPLVAELQQLSRSLRLPMSDEEREIDLDLRRELDQRRSHLLHRLHLLAIPWGEEIEARGKLGSFHELWRLRWRPEYGLRLTLASMDGGTIAAAAGVRARRRGAEILERSGGESLSPLATLIERLVRADLEATALDLADRLEERMAVAGDALDMMRAIPPLARTARTTRRSGLVRLVEAMVSLAAIGLPALVRELDLGASRIVVAAVDATHAALELLQEPALLDRWWWGLRELLVDPLAAPLVAGGAARLLLDDRMIGSSETASILSAALASSDALDGAAFVEGFLSGSPLLLLHDDQLIGSLDRWIRGMSNEDFERTLPLLRRSFALLSATERARLAAALAAREQRADERMVVWEGVAAETIELLALLLDRPRGEEESGDG